MEASVAASGTTFNAVAYLRSMFSVINGSDSPEGLPAELVAREKCGKEESQEAADSCMKKNLPNVVRISNAKQRAAADKCIAGIKAKQAEVPAYMKSDAKVSAIADQCHRASLGMPGRNDTDLNDKDWEADCERTYKGNPEDLAAAQSHVKAKQKLGIPEWLKGRVSVTGSEHLKDDCLAASRMFPGLDDYQVANPAWADECYKGFTGNVESYEARQAYVARVTGRNVPEMPEDPKAYLKARCEDEFVWWKVAGTDEGTTAGYQLRADCVSVCAPTVN